MEDQKSLCPNCGKEIPNQVLYKCVRCFTEYGVCCENTREGRVCPKCGMGARMIMDPKK